jgi:hypothetical protein
MAIFPPRIHPSPLSVCISPGEKSVKALPQSTLPASSLSTKLPIPLQLPHTIDMDTRSDTHVETGKVTTTEGACEKHTSAVILPDHCAPIKTAVDDDTTTQGGQGTSTAAAKNEQAVAEGVKRVSQCLIVSLPIATITGNDGKTKAVSKKLGGHDAGRNLLQVPEERMLVQKEFAPGVAELHPSNDFEQEQQDNNREHQPDSQLALKEAVPQGNKVEDQEHHQHISVHSTEKMGTALSSSEDEIRGALVAAHSPAVLIHKDGSSPPNSSPNQSVPPHLRPGFQGPLRTYGVQAARVSTR